MRTTSSFSDYQPIGHVGRVPIHVTTLLCALYCVGMIITTMLGAAESNLSGIAFSTEDFYRRGWLWEPFTCTFLNQANFFFLFGIFFFYTAGIEVERYLGRVTFVKFYILTLLAVPLALGVWRLLGVPATHATLVPSLIGMFIAFATLYPNIEYWGWIPLKYVAFACFALSCLQYFPHHEWPALSVVVAAGAIAFGFISYLRGGGSVEFSDLREKWFGPRRKFRVLPPPTPRAQRRAEPESSVDSIDPILEKIAKSGLASLSWKERALLEKAREDLLKKESPRH